MSLPDWSIFFACWLRKPAELAAALPSGSILADAVGRHLDLERVGPVLELGAGTGGITRGLLRNGCPPERLVVIERERPLAEVLRRQFAGVTVIEGDAGDLGALLAERGVTELATVVSTLPIKWFPFSLQQAIVSQTFDLLGAGGRLVQITNALHSPLPRERLGISGREAARIWLNFLPAQIWHYHRSPTAPAVA